MKIFLFNHYCALGFLGTYLVGSAADVQTGTFGKLQLKINNKPDSRGGVLMEFHDGLSKTAVRVEDGITLARMISPDGKLFALPLLNGLRILTTGATTRNIKENGIAHSYTFFYPRKLPDSGVDLMPVCSQMGEWQDNVTIAIWVSEPELADKFRLVRINVVTGKASVDIEYLTRVFQIRDFNKPIELVFSVENQDGGKPGGKRQTGGEPTK